MTILVILGIISLLIFLVFAWLYYSLRNQCINRATEALKDLEIGASSDNAVRNFFLIREAHLLYNIPLGKFRDLQEVQIAAALCLERYLAELETILEMKRASTNTTIVDSERSIEAITAELRGLSIDLQNLRSFDVNAVDESYAS